MTRPSFTVVVHTFNQARYLERTLCSVLDQGEAAEQTQVIVIDRGSSDHTHEVLSMYSDDVDRVLIQPGCTAAAGINLALKHARGRWVTVLGGGDLLMPEALDRVAAATAADQRTLWLAGEIVSVDASDTMRCRLKPTPEVSLASWLCRDERSWLPEIGVFWRRELWQQCGPLRDDLHHAHWYDLWARWLAAGIRPRVVTLELAAHREPAATLDPQRILLENREQIAIAEAAGGGLDRTQQATLRANLDQRRRILAMASAEAEGDRGHLFLMAQVLLRPWWLRDRALRRELLRKTNRPAA